VPFQDIRSGRLFKIGESELVHFIGIDGPIVGFFLPLASFPQISWNSPVMEESPADVPPCDLCAREMFPFGRDQQRLETTNSTGSLLTRRSPGWQRWPYPLVNFCTRDRPALQRSPYNHSPSCVLHIAKRFYSLTSFFLASGPW